MLAALTRGLAFVTRGRANMDVPSRDHGGDGVLVHHLADAVLQQDHELVEGFDLTLQLDAVDQINRNRDFIPPERVQERLLQGLTFCHGAAPCCLYGNRPVWLAHGSIHSSSIVTQGSQRSAVARCWARYAHTCSTRFVAPLSNQLTSGSARNQ